MSIRVGEQNPETKLLTDILIYDTRNPEGNMTTTVADSGYITLSDDKKYLLVTLYNGETYEESRNYDWYNNSTLRHHIFDVQNGVIPLAGFDFERSDMSLFNSSQTKNTRELMIGIDSLERVSNETAAASFEPLIRSQMFTHTTWLLRDSATPPVKHNKFSVLDTLSKMNLDQKKALYERAMSMVRSSQGSFSFDETTSKEALTQLYKYKVEWHRKLSLPVSIMIFFLIGAPLGAIIRKGGLGMPIVVSVSFFVVYYIISITGEKMAKEGTWGSFAGMWIATFILLPISVYLTYKATNDSNLFNAEWYILHFKKLKAFVLKIIPTKKIKS